MGLMGWIVAWFTVLMSTVGVQITTCTQGSQDAWLLSALVYTPISAVVLGLICITKNHHVKWIYAGLPLVPILAYCAYFTFPFLLHHTVFGSNPCSVLKHQDFDAYEITQWLRIWAPLQIIVIAGYFWILALCWTRRNSFAQ